MQKAKNNRLGVSRILWENAQRLKRGVDNKTWWTSRRQRKIVSKEEYGFLLSQG